MKITAEIIDAIQRSTNILVCGHIRPDGDCVGSALAMRHICEKLGKNADAVCDAEKPTSFAFLPDYEYFCAPRFDKYDLFIAVDCAVDKRLGVYIKQMTAADTVIDIDHHPTNDGYGDINYIDEHASSTCEIIYSLFADTNLLDKDSATMLYTGLSTDTGHFMHSNTTDAVFKAALGLSRLGVDVADVNHSLYCNNSFARMKLTARAIGGITLYAGGKIALMTIMQNDLSECGCKSEDTEGLIDNAKSISGVEIAICICEQPGGLYRVSLRSVNADVSAVAGVFGGGGHKLASGCIINGTRDEVTKKITDAAKRAL